MKNGSSALLNIFLFDLVLDKKPVEVLSPTKWLGEFYASVDLKNSVYPNHVRWGTPINFIKPGSTLKGFVIKSTRSPGLVKYYVLGDSKAPVVTATPLNDEPIPNCPGFFYNKPAIEGEVAGSIIGPAPLNQLSIEFKIKKLKSTKIDADLEEDFVEVSPHKDKGKVLVLVKSNKDFNVTTINLSSIHLGQGLAPVESSVIKGNKNNEELRMVFDLSKIGIECDRDRALFLAGKTTEGKDILGAAPIKTINCTKGNAN